MMLINHSLQLESSGRSQSSFRRQTAAAFSVLNSKFHKSLSNGLLHAARRIYQQNPLMVGSVAGFSLVSLIFVVIIFTAAGNKTALHQTNVLDGSQFSSQYTFVRIRYELNEIALSILEDKDWNQRSIDTFTYAWNSLDALEKAEVKQTVWFQSLENALSSRSGVSAKDKRAKLLVDLSATLGLPLAGKELTVAKRPAKTSTTDKETAAKPAPKTQPAATQIASNRITSQAANTRTTNTPTTKTLTPSTQIAKAPPQKTVPPQTQRVDSAAGGERPVQADLSAEPLSVAALSKGETASTADIVSPSIPPAAIPPAEVKPKRINKVIRTPIPVESQSAVMAVKPAAATQAVVSNVTISESELKRITKEFVSSYETGNIVAFSALFAEKAVSNDDADLNTIKKEYANLFANTSDRRMIIGDLKWDFSKNSASGEGQLAVEVKSSGARIAQTYSGKIQIVVEKQDDGVQITKLYHALQ